MFFRGAQVDIYRIISALEYDSAAAYLRIKENEDLLNQVKTCGISREDIVDYMIRASYRNARKVEESGWDYKLPVVNEYKIAGLEKRIRKSLSDVQIREIGDVRELLTSLSAAEKGLSQLYEIVSAHFAELSRYFQNLSDEFERLAHDESDHSRMIGPLMDEDR
jgi:hypothetical protein